jgi:hypothetical protein
MRTFHDSADQSWVHQGRIRTAIRRAWGWINRRAFTQTNCAWCQSPKVMLPGVDHSADNVAHHLPGLPRRHNF